MVNLVTVKNRELVKVGKYDLSTGEFEATQELIQSAIKAHEAGVLRKPVVRLGHNDPRFSGDPAVGWIDNVRASEDGNTLYGDLVGVPEWLANVMPSAYPSVSIEGLYDYTAPDGSTHDFILTGLALLGVTPPGISDLKSVQDVAKLYEVDSPIAAAIGEIGGTAVKFTVEAAQTQTEKLETQKEGGPAMALPENVAKALGIDANADEATIAAKLAEAGLRLAEKPAVVEVEVVAEEAPAVPVAAAAPVVAGLMQIDPTQYAELVAAAQAGQRAEARQIADDDDRTVMAAIGQGKIPPARKDHFLGLMKADREGTKQVLASLAAGLIPLKETGHQGVAGMVGSEDGAPSPDKQAVDYAFSNVMARLGVSTKKGVNN
jgi:Mu-like prophage I protein